MKELRLVLLPAAAGILAGLFFGEYCAWISPFGSAYVMLLQAAVYPYLISSLLHGLGSLRPDQAFRLFHRGWLIYVLAWVLTFAALVIVGVGIPVSHPPVASTQDGPGVDPSTLLSLVIPQDVVSAIAKNYVPAVVLFCVAYGVAMQRLQDKSALLSIFDGIRQMSLQFWKWVVKLVPFAVFALVADTAGTTSIENLEHMVFFLVLLFGVSAILSFWLLPAVMTALAPLRYREILSDYRSALIVSLATTLSVTALPFITEATRKVAKQLGAPEKESDEVIATNLSITYVFGQLGNFFVLLFMLFAVYFFQAPQPVGDRVLLPFMTFLSNVGSPTATVNGVAFLGMWLGLPQTTSDLFVELLVIIRYGMLMTSVTGFAFLSILVTLSYFGKLQIRPLKLATAIVLPMIAIVALGWGTRSLQENLVGEGRKPYLNFTLSPASTSGIESEILTSLDRGRPPLPDSQTDQPVMERILTSGELWVGYNAGIIPYCYHNASGDLVGYDVEAAFSLARSLGVKLVLVPFEWQSLMDDLNAKRFDIAMAGIYVTNERLQESYVSSPYFESPFAIFAPRDKIRNYRSRADINAIENLRIGVFNDPVLIPRAKLLFPGAEIVIVDSYAQLPDFEKIDAAIWTLEQAKALAAANPSVQAIAPVDMGSDFLFAYLMPRDAVEWGQYLDYWLTLRERSGEDEAAKAYWMKGQSREEKKARWSILRNVLHWVD